MRSVLYRLLLLCHSVARMPSRQDEKTCTAIDDETSSTSNLLFDGCRRRLARCIFGCAVISVCAVAGIERLRSSIRLQAISSCSAESFRGELWQRTLFAARIDCEHDIGQCKQLTPSTIWYAFLGGSRHLRLRFHRFSCGKVYRVCQPPR